MFRFARAPLALPGVALLLFTAALLEAGSRYRLLPEEAAWGLSVVAAGVVAFALCRREPSANGERRLALLLAGAAVFGLGSRALLGLETASGPESAARAADRVDSWLSDRTREIGDAAYLLARTPHLAAAVEGSDAIDYRRQAFRVLSEWPLPTTGIGRAEATLYDRGLRPVAWSGAGPDLEGPLAEFFPDGVRLEDCPDPAFPLFLYAERGGRGYLAAAECTRNLLGLVTVEFPVLEDAPPSSGAPPVSAFRRAARRGLETRILRGAEDTEVLARFFERRGDRFVDGPSDGLRYYFALRAYDGQLLGAASTAVAPRPAREAEQRSAVSRFSTLALLLGGLAAAPGLWRAGTAGALACIWMVRFLLTAGAEALPAGVAVRLLASPGASLLPDLHDEPLAALLTAAALFLSVRRIQPVLRWRGGGRGRFAAALSGAAAGAAAVAAAAFLGSAGRSGAAPLAPTWRVGVGWPEVLGWTALLVALAALLLLSASLLRARASVLVPAFGVVAGSALLLSSPALAYAALPLGFAAFVITSRRGRLALRALRRPLLLHEPGFSFVIAFLLFAAPAVLWYPALYWHEDEARRRYASDAVPVQILRHRFTVCHALDEASRALDAEVAALDLFRPDTAYRLWLSTGLARLSAASALEIRGPGGQVARFAVGLSRRPDPFPSAPAPLDWSVIAECGSDAPAGLGRVLSTSRRFPSGHSVTLRAADRAAEVPFLAQTPGIADYFLLRGDASPSVFHGKDLRFAPRPTEESLRQTLSSGRQRSVVGISVAGEPFEVSWFATRARDHGAALLGWVFLAALAALLVALAARLRLLVPAPAGRPPRRSFQMQLSETLAAAVLIAIVGLAVFAQQRLSALLEAASDRDAFTRSRTVERVAGELGALNPDAAAPDELASRLAHAADQLDTDAALYAGGGLLAVSRPELAQTGLLPPRPPPAALVSPAGVDPPFFSIQEAGALRYRILWIPLEVRAPSVGRALLAVPLPADEAERVEGVRALQRTLLLGSGSMALVFAILLPGFLARRLAAPVRSLARATTRIADGELGTPVPFHGTLAELRLLAAGVERLVRRIPSVRRRMREEAAADLARRVAHDIKNALAPIGLAADYIRRVLRDPRGQNPQQAVDESVADILGQVERLRRISSEFSALGAPLRLETVNPATLVRDTVAPYVRARTGPEVSFRPSGSTSILADPEIVARIVENLIQNALEAIGSSARDEDEEGSIQVRVIAGAGGVPVRIEIEDDGPGVPPELRERIFDAAFSTRTRGSGLGLANARRFAEAHAGRLTAGARRDGRRGLLMILELPVGGPPEGASK